MLAEEGTHVRGITISIMKDKLQTDDFRSAIENFWKFGLN